MLNNTYVLEFSECFDAKSVLQLDLPLKMINTKTCSHFVRFIVTHDKAYINVFSNVLVHAANISDYCGCALG